MDSILNVDDYGPGRYARTKVLQQAGFAVREASTGREALQLIAEHNPPIVLLDVNLPDMSGFEVCKQVKLNPKTGSTTVVHISATNIQVQHQVEGLDCGADSYMVEPVDPAVLIATVKAFLRARKAEDALRRSNEELERFGYRVAHDLNEPLRTMVTHAQLLERDLGKTLSANSTRSLQFVIDASKRMHQFIEGLLDNHCVYPYLLWNKRDTPKTAYYRSVPSSAHRLSLQSSTLHQNNPPFRFRILSDTPYHRPDRILLLPLPTNQRSSVDNARKVPIYCPGPCTPSRIQ